MRRPRKPVPPNTVTVRPFVATMAQIASLCRSFSLLVVEEPIRAIEQPINLARHDEVVLMQSFDLLGAQRDSRTTPSESKPIRWTTLAPIGQRSFSCVSAARRLASITTLPVRTFCGMLKRGRGEGQPPFVER